MASLLQVLFLVGIVVAVVALTDWRWGLLIGCVVGFVSAYQAERVKRRQVK